MFGRSIAYVCKLYSQLPVVAMVLLFPFLFIFIIFSVAAGILFAITGFVQTLRELQGIMEGPAYIEMNGRYYKIKRPSDTE